MDSNKPIRYRIRKPGSSPAKWFRLPAPNKNASWGKTGTTFYQRDIALKWALTYGGELIELPTTPTT